MQRSPTHKPTPDTPVDRLYPPAHICNSLLAPPASAAPQHERTQTPTARVIVIPARFC